jgi:hypothetical protein
MGIVQSVYNQSYPQKPHDAVNDIPDLSGKVIIVTGPTSEETAKVRADSNYD